MKLTTIQAAMAAISAAFDRDPPATPGELTALQNSRALPPDYIEFLRWAGSGECQLGATYFSLWPASEVEQLNQDFQIQRYLGPSAFCFASDGGGTAFVFRNSATDGAVWAVPLGDLDWSSAKLVGASLPDAIGNALDGTYQP